MLAAQLLELLARYSCTCHGLSERGAPFGARVSTLGVDRYTVPPLPTSLAEVLERRARVLQVLDRLQEHHRVGGRGEGFDEIALEAQVHAPVAHARVLVRLRVGVHPHHARCAAAASTSEP